MLTSIPALAACCCKVWPLYFWRQAWTFWRVQELVKKYVLRKKG